METVVISGANRGIGLEFVRQYKARGALVYACCRLPEEATELAKLADKKVRILPLDVADEGSINKLVTLLEGVKISLFINNAGIYGVGQTLQEVNATEWLEVMQVNCVAPLLLTRVLLPLMDRDVPGKLVYMSSRMGSISDNSGGSTYVYRSSKTALNQVVKSLSVDLASDGLPVAALHPGWVKTDMGGPNALIDTQTSVAGLISVIDNLDMEKSGQFFNYDGQTISW